MQYTAGDRIVFTEDIVIAHSPFSNYRIDKGRKGFIKVANSSYLVRLDGNYSVTISHEELERSSKVIVSSSSEPVRNLNLEAQTEGRILEMTADIWSQFRTLEQTHPSDLTDLANAIHDVQKIISVRMARRTNPQQFPTYK